MRKKTAAKESAIKRIPILSSGLSVKCWPIYLVSLFSILTYFILYLNVNAQDIKDSQKILGIMADAVLQNATFEFVDQQSGRHFTSAQEAPPGSQLRPESPYNDWRYWNGVLNLAMIRLAESLNNPDYSKFAVNNIAFSFDNYRYFEENYKNQGKWNYPFGEFFIMEELDDYGVMGASLIEVYQQDPQDRYKAYLEKASNYILTKQSRLNDSTLVRSFPYKWTLWADDLYMSIAFLSRMGEFSGGPRYFQDAARQVINFHKYLFDNRKGLMHHNWFSDLNRQGVAFWGRANGWALLAQVDLLDNLPKDDPQRDTLQILLQRHILGIASYQGSNGLWHQLLDKEDSYLETSCSAMFVYTVARSVNRGYIDPRYASIAKRGWEGILSRIHPDGKVEGVCTGTVVSDNLVDYYSRPTPLNDVHGIGAILLAGSEMLELLK
jgi:unsaturated rhamnogalacturonyl hydrolase